MSTQIQTLTFNSNPISFITINGKEYFLAKNVCDILELKNVSQALSRVQIGDIISNDTPTTSGIQKMSYVDEFALYDLIMASKKPQAVEFKKWTYEVLQQIRKTGKFEIQQLTQREQVLLLAKNLLDSEEENQKLQIENIQKQKIIEVLQNENLEKDNENQKLKQNIKDFFKGAELFTRRQVCHFLARQSVIIKEEDLTEFLNKKKWLCIGEHNKNKATAEACKIGWFVNDISIFEVNGHKKTNEYGKFTVNGMVEMYNYFKK
jgi:anti-repressor protein